MLSIFAAQIYFYTRREVSNPQAKGIEALSKADTTCKQYLDSLTVGLTSLFGTRLLLNPRIENKRDLDATTDMSGLEVAHTSLVIAPSFPPSR